jgi:hypothetical protein
VRVEYTNNGSDLLEEVKYKVKYFLAVTSLLNTTIHINCV